MKYLIILALAAGGYFYFSKLESKNHEVKDWSSLVNSVEREGASLPQVKRGVHLLAQRLCNDASFQKSGGSSVVSCNESFKKLSVMCENRIFNNAPSKYESKSEVAALGKRFASCVRAI